MPLSKIYLIINYYQIINMEIKKICSNCQLQQSHNQKNSQLKYN